MSKKKSVLIIILALCFSSMVMILFTQKTKASSDLNYTFKNEYFLQDFNYDNFTETIFNADKFNMRNLTTNIQDNYTGSYNFLNELGLTSTDIIFVNTDNSGIKANVSINSSYFGHNNILNLTPHSTGSNAHVENNIDSIVSGTIEFWILNTDATYRTNFFGYDGGTIGFQIRVDHDDFAYYDGSEHSFAKVYDNIWYHISIDFECGSSVYKGLLADKFRITINGIP